MALVNPALMGTLSTAAMITGMATGNPAIASAARSVQLGTMGVSAASQLLSRPKISASGSGRSPYGNRAPSDGTSQSRSINTNAVTAIIKNLETIILRLETSNSYLKSIAAELSPKAKKEIMRQFADQNKLMFETYSTRLGKLFINSFGKEFMQRYSNMNKVFGKALQNGSVSNSQLMMFRVFGNMPFFKDFFGNIRTIIQDSKDTNEEIKITLKNIIPNKLDAIIHLMNMQNDILRNTQGLIGRVGIGLIGQQRMNSSSAASRRNRDIQSLLDELERANRVMDNRSFDIMRKAMNTLDNMNESLVTFRGALLNILDKPLTLLKTALLWFVRYKIASSFFLPFMKSFSGSDTGKSLTQRFYTGTFLESGVNTAKGFVGGVKSKLTGSDPNVQSTGNAFVDFLRAQGKKVSEYFKKISQEKWFVDLMSSIKTAFLTGITKIMKTVTMVILGYRMMRAGTKFITNWFMKSNALIKFGREVFNEAAKSFRDGYNNPLAPLDIKNKVKSVKKYVKNIPSSIVKGYESGRSSGEIAAKRSDLIKNSEISLSAVNEQIKLRQSELRKLRIQGEKDSEHYKQLEEKLNELNETRDNIKQNLSDFVEMTNEEIENVFKNAKEKIKKDIEENSKELESDFSRSDKAEGKSKGIRGMFGGLLGGGKSILKIGGDFTNGVVKFISNGISRVFGLVSKVVNWAGIAIMVGTAVRTGFKMMLSFASKDDSLVKAKSNKDFIQKLISGTLKFVYKSIFKALGYAFNPQVWKAIGTGLWEGNKAVLRYVGAAILGGATSLIGKILPAGVGSKITNKLIGFLGLNKEWELISKSFGEGKNANVELSKMAKDTRNEEEKEKREQESLEAQKQTAENTLKMTDYLKPKNLSLGFGVGLHKMTKVLSNILGVAGVDTAKFEQRNLNTFTNWSRSDNGIVSSIGKGYVGASEGKTWQQLIVSNDASIAARVKNTEAINTLTEAVNKQTEAQNATTETQEDIEKQLEEIRQQPGYNQGSDSDIAYGTLTDEELDKVKQNKESIEAIRQRKTGEYDARLSRGWDKLVDKFQVWAGRDDNVPILNINTKGPTGMTGDPVLSTATRDEIFNSLKRSIKISEGKRLSRYIDSLGYPTIGYGHKLRPGENYTNISEAEANQIFDSDYNRIYSTISANQIFGMSDPFTQAVLMDLAFNMGPGFLSKFPNFSKAISERNFDLASSELLNSAYAKQVGKRALRNAAALRSGIFYEDRMNPKVQSILSDKVTYPTRNAPPLAIPSDSEVLQWLKPIGEGVTNSKILALNPYLKYNLVNYAKEKGRVLEVTSALRTREEQEALYKKKGGVGVAKPGHSRHESGLAIDINSKNGLLDTTLLSKHNLYRPLESSEPWHVELIGGRNAAMAAGAGYGAPGTSGTYTGEEGRTDPITNFFGTLSFLLTGKEIGDPVGIDNSILMKYPPLRKLVNIITKREMDTNFDIMENGSAMTGNEIGNKVKSIGTMISDPVTTAAKCMVKFAEIVATDKSGGSIAGGKFNNTNVITNVSPTNIMSANTQTANSGNSGRESGDMGGIMDMGLMAFMI